jgi:hypothetical protein
MNRPADSNEPPSRRRVLAALVNTMVAVVGGALSALLGVFALRPASTDAKNAGSRRARSATSRPMFPCRGCSRCPDPMAGIARTRETVFLVWTATGTCGRFRHARTSVAR